MENLEGLLERVSARHRAALRWFVEHAGTNLLWPAPLSDGTFLATRAKGIYKPNWTKYALSIRQNLNSPYHDIAPIMRPDGTWSYSYFQENSNPADRDLAYTNRGLLACCEDKVPIGVMRQVNVGPQVRYHVVGLALVTKWEAGYFFLEGFSSNVHSHSRGLREKAETYFGEYKIDFALIDKFDPKDIFDERTRIASSIVQRQRQSEFRLNLLQIYDNRCCISSCDAVEALEAAHIVPYLGPKTNHPSNGLLLRADLHILFDLGLFAVDTKTMTVIVSSNLADTVYSTFSGTRLYLPRDENTIPNKEALNWHRAWTGL